MLTTVAIGGLGAIGWTVAEALDRDPRNLRLIAVSAADLDAAARRVSSFVRPPAVVPLHELALADLVVEAAPAAVFPDIARPAIDAGRTLVVASAGALLAHPELIDRARAKAARIVIPSGALAGLDAVRAAMHGVVGSVTLVTRKPPASLAGAPYLARTGMDLGRLDHATCVFRGDAGEAAAGFPANANVMAALALAGVGPQRTHVEIWADPNVTRNSHTVCVESEAARLELRVESAPSPGNPRTSRLAPMSVLACLHDLHSPLKVGS